MLSAEELLDRGRAAVKAGRHAHARRWLIRCEQVATDPETIAQAELPLAYLEAEQGQTADALERCDRVVSDERLPGALRGLAASQRALLHLRLGDYAKALDDFSLAEAELADPEAVARLHLNRGNVHLQRGDLAGAADDFAKAAGNGPDPGMRFKAGFNLAYVELLRGDLVGALVGMDSLGEWLAQQSPLNVAVVAQDRAEVLLTAGLAEEAERSLAEASRIYAAHRLGQFRGEADLLRARALLRSNNERAAAVGRSAAQAFRRRGSESFALRADLVVLTARVQAGRAGPALLAESSRLEHDLREVGLDQEATLAAMQTVRLQLVRGDPAGASATLARIRVSADARLETRLTLRELRADLATARGRRTAALDHVRAGLAELHEWQSSFGSLDLQSTLVGHGRHLAEQGLRAARDSGRPELMFEWSERARALVSRVAPVRPPEDPELASALSELRVLMGRRPKPGSPEARRAAKLRSTIRQRSWYGEGSRDVTEPVTAGELRERLAADDAALVAHVNIDGELIAVVVTGEGVRRRSLGPTEGIPPLLDAVRADLDALATDLPGPIHDVAAASLVRGMADLSAMIWDPVAAEVGERRLVLTPSGILAGTPWSLLPGLRGRPLTVPRSATHWLRAVASPTASNPLVGLVTGPGVPRAADEVARAADRWPAGRVRVTTHVDADGIVRISDAVDVLHVAAHGVHSVETPMFSALQLTDGPFYGYDVDRVRSVPDTVLLSACELGRGSVRTAEETVGMTAAWLHAGVRTVIAATALVSDEVASETLAAVHAGLARGLSPADALAEALAARPGSTAPFITFGAGW